jgi:hypothetical protein
LAGFELAGENQGIRESPEFVAGCCWKQELGVMKLEPALSVRESLASRAGLSGLPAPTSFIATSLDFRDLPENG